MKRIKLWDPRVLKVGLVGCGAIGSTLARTIDKQFKRQLRLTYLCDIHSDHAKQLSKKISTHPRLIPLNELIQKSDLIIEAASARISGHIAQEALKRHKSVLIMSVGGLIQIKNLHTLTQRSKGTLLVPSGAICGLDGLKAAHFGKISSVTLTTSKPVKALFGAAYLKRTKVNLANLKSVRTIFKGSARQAIRLFPENINVSCVLSLAGIGADKTRVQIVCNPSLKRNVHEVKIEGDFGVLTTRSENVPSKTNPKTSHIAILSALASLEQFFKQAKIGT